MFMRVCMYVCLYVYVYVCVYLCVFMCVCICRTRILFLIGCVIKDLRNEVQLMPHFDL